MFKKGIKEQLGGNKAKCWSSTVEQGEQRQVQVRGEKPIDGEEQVDGEDGEE